LSVVEWEPVLWWVMLATAVSAAGLSIVTAMLDRQKADEPTRRRRFCMHLASYCLLSISILVFVLRGLLAPE
jgi:hypothetical protein